MTTTEQRELAEIWERARSGAAESDPMTWSDDQTKLIAYGFFMGFGLCADDAWSMAKEVAQ